MRVPTRVPCRTVSRSRSPTSRANRSGSPVPRWVWRAARRATRAGPPPGRSTSGCGSRASGRAGRSPIFQRRRRAMGWGSARPRARVSCCLTARSGRAASGAPPGWTRGRGGGWGSLREAGREELQLWVANRFCYQQAIPIKDAAIMSNCPEPAVRRAWIQRIVDHDGRADGEGGLEAWLRLAEAMGVERDTLLAGRWVLPGVRFAVEAYITFCRTRPWIEAVAASPTERFPPTILGQRLSAIPAHYQWIHPARLEYFRARLHQAPRDAEHALALVTERCRTRELQERAVAALDFKCDVLWSLLDAVERGPLPGNAP